MNNQRASTPFTTPVLFLIFDRPETTYKVMEAIRKIRPTKLYIAAVGPREGRPEDIDKCAAAWEITGFIDWDCDVTRLFRKENLGGGKGPSSAIDWFFEHETEGIILEDDCLPSTDFFFFCAELLDRYRYDTRIMEIGGNNFGKEGASGREYSYFFSNMIFIWGWATWRRAWKLYNYEMNHYNEISGKEYLLGHYDYKYQRDHFSYVFQKMHTGDHRTNRKTFWDYQWQFVCKINSGLIIVPERNLVTTLGFGDGATNTGNLKEAGHDLKLEIMTFPLKHPELVMVAKRRDHWHFSKICSSTSFRIRSHVKRFIPTPVFEKVRPLFRNFILWATKGRTIHLDSSPRMLENRS